MHIPSTIRTAFGPRSLPRRPMIRVTLTPSELHILISAIERNASDAEREGCTDVADLLFWRAAALREAAR